MSIKAIWTLRIVSFVFLGFVLGNLLFLNYIILKGNIVDTSQIATVASIDQNTQYCDNEDCVAEIYQTISEATKESTFVTNENVVQSGDIGEFFVFLGSGESTSTDWEDVPGARVTIDTQRYGDLEQVTFEAGVFIPTGNQTVSVRLFNTTAKHPVWFSEITHSGGEKVLITSDEISLDSGENVYQVQMKSSLGYITELTQSRIRILTR